MEQVGRLSAVSFNSFCAEPVVSGLTSRSEHSTGADTVPQISARHLPTCFRGVLRS